MHLAQVPGFQPAGASAAHSMRLWGSALPRLEPLPSSLSSSPTRTPFCDPPGPQVYASYGGLLMQLTGEPKRLEELDVDQNVYLLCRKVS